MGSPQNVLFRSCIVMCLVTLFAAQAHGTEHPLPRSESDRKSFRFNVSPNGYPPYLIIEDNQISGIIWEVVSRIGERLDFDIQSQQFPHKRVEQMLSKGLLDGTARAREWTENPDDFVFTDPIVKVEEVIFFPTGSTREFKSIEDLFSLTLVTHLGYRYPPLESHFKAGNIKRFDVSGDRNVLIYTIKGDDLDAAVSDRLVGQWILSKEGMKDELRASSSVISEVGYSIMLRPGLEAFANDFNTELAAMRDNGELDEIMAKYR